MSHETDRELTRCAECGARRGMCLHPANTDAPELRHQSCTQGTFADGMRHAASIVEDFRQSTEEGDTLAMVIEAIQKETGVHQVCAVPEGWKLVPVVLSEAMLEAAAVLRNEAEGVRKPLRTSALWLALLDAAPDYEFVACTKQEGE